LIRVKRTFTLQNRPPSCLSDSRNAPIAIAVSQRGPSGREHAISNVMNVSKTMTIKEAAAVWNDPRADFLERWGDMFDVRLEDITQYHLMKYQVQRFSETPQSIVDVEMRCLIALLKHAGISRWESA
jgi:hypothetical protein